MTKYVKSGSALLLFTFILCGTGLRAQTKDTLYRLYKAKQYAALHTANTTPTHPFFYFYQAVYANVCNQPAVSNAQLDQLVKGKKEPAKDIAFEYWKLRGDNYVKLFDYTNAYAMQKRVLDQFPDQLDSTDYSDRQDALRIWKSLLQEQPQTITQPASAIIPLTHDLAGLINIKVHAAGTDTNFVFDTGAGMSCVTESLAAKLGFRIMPDTGIKVAGFNAIYNPVRIAIADELTIGAITVRNEPFLVFRDEALTFAGGAYKINGIIGFPIAKGVGTITIAANQLKIEKAATTDTAIEKNLFVEELRPLVLLKYKGKTLPFNFDTGAGSTQFSKTFYDAYGEALKETGYLEKSMHASAGGASEINALVINNFKLHLGKQEITIPVLKIDTGNYHVSGKELYGNIGQDLLKQYKEVTISFTGNYLRLSN